MTGNFRQICKKSFTRPYGAAIVEITISIIVLILISSMIFDMGFYLFKKSEKDLMTTREARAVASYLGNQAETGAISGADCNALSASDPDLMALLAPAETGETRSGRILYSLSPPSLVLKRVTSYSCLWCTFFTGITVISEARAIIETRRLATGTDCAERVL